MIKKWLLISLIFFSFFSPVQLTAQTKEKQQLIDILEKLHSTYECNFSYIDKDVKDIFIEPPPDNATLEQAIEYLQNKTHLDFTILGGNFITITKKEGNGFSICGYLIDINTNEHIVGAVIQSKNSSTVSDLEGYFELKNLHEEDIITIRHISFIIVNEYAKAYNTGKCETIFLTPKFEDLSEIILTNYLTNGINKIIDGSISINYKNFGAVPGLIETDVLQTLQAMPGFQSVNETVSNLNIRGGTHDQNLILWDGIKVYQSGHFFGLISTLNPRMTKRVSLFKNGTPANYTDGISGTVDMKTDHVVNKNLLAEVGLNFINIDAYADIPIGKKSSIQIGSRTSINQFFDTPTYNEYYDRAFQNTDVVNSTSHTNSTDQKFDFHDVSLRWIYDITKKDQVRVNFMHLNNSLKLSENAFGGTLYSSRESVLDQNNFAGGLHYTRKWNNTIETEIQSYATSYDLNAVNYDIINEQILTQGNEVLEAGSLVSTTYKFNDRLELNSAYQFTETTITNKNKVNYPPENTLKKSDVQAHGLSFESSYATKDFNTNVRAGVRLNYFNKFDKFIIEPRLSINHKLTDRFSVQLLGEFKNQVTTLITDYENNFLGIERRRWTLSNNEDIPIIKSKQISGGANYSHKGLMVNAEVYYKTVDGIASLSQGFQNQYEYADSFGSYDVKGLDFIISNKFERFNTWFSYSYADNKYTFEDFNEKTFPSNLDIRHVLSFATTYTIKDLKLSAGYNWRTGKPTTSPVEGNEIVNGQINYNDANSNNLKSYKRLDASAIYNFSLSSTVKAEAGLSILNLLNKKNKINNYYQINTDNEVEEIKEYSLGLTPNVAFRVFF
ncbi:MAG: TonB-dependent receptor plug domain-containing protein [Flavobacteriaceae bacterium]